MQQQQQLVQLTPEIALQNIGNVIRQVQATGEQHALFSACLACLDKLVRDSKKVDLTKEPNKKAADEISANIN